MSESIRQADRMLEENSQNRYQTEGQVECQRNGQNVCHAGPGRMREYMPYSMPKYVHYSVNISWYALDIVFDCKPHSLSEHICQLDRRIKCEKMSEYISNRLPERKPDRNVRRHVKQNVSAWGSWEKYLAMVSLNLRRSKERCPEHQVSDLVRHCPRKIFKQIAWCFGTCLPPCQGVSWKSLLHAVGFKKLWQAFGIQTGHADTDGCVNGCDDILTQPVAKL